MSRELWQARMREISEEIRQIAAREAALVAEWHRLEYALAEENWGSPGGAFADASDTIVDGVVQGKGKVAEKKSG